MIVIPLRDLVHAELLDDAPSSGVLTLVRLEKQPSCFARVLGVGPDVRDTHVGERYVISRLQGIEVGAGQVVLPESAILARMEEA